MTERVVIADDVTLIRQMIAFACVRQHMEVMGLAGSRKALADLCRHEPPDVVIAGSPFENEPIDECLDEILGLGCQAVVVSHDPSPSRMVGALDRGAAGYLLSDARTEEIAAAAAAVAAGGAALHPVAAGIVVQQWRQYRASGSRPDQAHRGLTPREREILDAMVEGLAAKSIARSLGVSQKTIENHKTRIFAKLGARTQAHAVSIAAAQGVTSAPCCTGADSMASRLVSCGNAATSLDRS